MGSVFTDDFIYQGDIALTICLERDVAHSYKVTCDESEHQAKILKHLEAAGFVTEKIVVANKAGGGDIWAIAPCGQAWRIEAKREDGILSALQKAKLLQAHKNNAVVMCPYGYDDFKRKFKYLTSS